MNYASKLFLPVALLISAARIDGMSKQQSQTEQENVLYGPHLTDEARRHLGLMSESSARIHIPYAIEIEFPDEVQNSQQQQNEPSMSSPAEQCKAIYAMEGQERVAAYENFEKEQRVTRMCDFLQLVEVWYKKTHKLSAVTDETKKLIADTVLQIHAKQQEKQRKLCAQLATLPEDYLKLMIYDSILWEDLRPIIRDMLITGEIDLQLACALQANSQHCNNAYYLVAGDISIQDVLDGRDSIVNILCNYLSELPKLKADATEAETDAYIEANFEKSMDESSKIEEQYGKLLMIFAGKIYGELLMHQGADAHNKESIEKTVAGALTAAKEEILYGKPKGGAEKVLRVSPEEQAWVEKACAKFEQNPYELFESIKRISDFSKKLFI